MSIIRNILTSQTTFAVVIAALLVVLPLSYGFSTGIMIVLLALSLASLKHHGLQWDKAMLIPAVFYGLMLTSLFWASESKNSFRGLERQIAMVLIPLAFIAMPALTQKTRDRILYWFALSLAVLATFLLVWAGVIYEPGNAKVFFYHSLVAPLELNAIYVSVFVSLSILFLLFKQKRSLWSLMTLGILMVFLLLLASKLIIVATAILGCFGMLTNFTRATIIKVLPFIILGFGLLVFTDNPVSKRFKRELTASNVTEVLEADRFNKVYDWTGTTIRLFQARIFSEMLHEDPIFWSGYGINNSKDKIIEKQKQYNLWQGYYTYNFHNQYLQAFAELGIFGLLCLFLLLGALLKRYLETKDSLLLFLFFIMLVVFITESYLWRQRGLYHFLVFYCLFLKVSPGKPLTVKET